MALNNASAAEPTDFDPNTSLGNEASKRAGMEVTDPKTGETSIKSLVGVDSNWGLLVWAGELLDPEMDPHPDDRPNKKNNVGWAWCIEPSKGTPFETSRVYDKANAEKLQDFGEYHDAVIGLARMMQTAVARRDSKAAANYYVYLLMFIAKDTQDKEMAEGTITGDDPYLYRPGSAEREKAFPAYTGSHDEFTKLTGYRIEGKADGGRFNPLKFVKVKEGQIPPQPKDAYITIVKPVGQENKLSGSQTIMPVDQPGLPDENGGSGSNPVSYTHLTLPTKRIV